MARSNADTVGVIKDAQRLKNLIVVGKRLALAHEHYACRALAKVIGNVKYLVDDFLGGQRAPEAVEAGSAKSAAHSAAGLGGYADRELVATGHADGLDRNAIVVLE